MVDAIRPKKIVYLMRGLPSCGKSYTARHLAGKDGVVLETDQYFFTEIGDDSTKYSYKKELLDDAREWIFDKLNESMEKGITPIVIDRDNGSGKLTRRFAKHIMNNGYHVQFKEPTSKHWQEIKVLLKYREITRPILYQWAEMLAKMNRNTHRVSASEIRQRMDIWANHIAIKDLLDSRE